MATKNTKKTTAKKATKKAPAKKAAPVTPDSTTESTGSAKLAASLKKLAFIQRLIERQQGLFATATGADSIRAALSDAKANVNLALAHAKDLPPTFRFGKSKGAVMFAQGDFVKVTEKHAEKYIDLVEGGESLQVVRVGEHGTVVAATAAGVRVAIRAAHLMRAA